MPCPSPVGWAGIKQRCLEHNELCLWVISEPLTKEEATGALRLVKADPRTRRIPVVVVTSSREERDIVKSYDLGVNSYMIKPVDFEQFNEAVRVLGLYWLLINQTPGL